MSWNRRYAIVSYLRSALWIAPVFAFVVAQLLFRVSNALQLDFGWIPGFEFTGEGIASAMDIDITLQMSFIVFTFGSLLVAIQVASGQLTPRIIATTLLRDNVIRWVVGLFFLGLLLAVGARNRLETMPQFIISLTAILGLVSTIGFLFLIDYAARLLRPVSIVWRIGEHGIKVIESEYPNPVDWPEPPAMPRQQLGPVKRTVLHEGYSAVIIAVNLRALTESAQKADGIIEFVPRVGDFVAAGEPLFRLRGGAAAINDRLLREQVAFGRERTIEQDSTFAFRVIVDIAIKALSKAINDPTTAVLAIDQLHRLLRTAGSRHLRGEEIRGRDGQVRLIFRTPNWEDFVELSFSEIRQYGAESFQVARRLRAMIGQLLESLPDPRRPALRLELDLLDHALAKHHARPEELALARVPDTQGLGGAARAA